MWQVKIPYEVIQKARKAAEEIYKNRSRNNDKFLQGDEAKADRVGFQVEFAHCYAFKQPFPKVLKGREVDEFDSQLAVPNENGLLQLFKFDVKTSEEFLINKEQYQKKRVDAYLFEKLDFLDYSTGAIFLKIYGWIMKKDVPDNSELKTFEHNKSQAYLVKRTTLKSPLLLFGLIQPERI